MSSEDESRALGSPHFWDERYSKAGDNDEPTHEWFRAFDALGPYFEKHLFTPRKPASNPRILHLGSGDSTIPYDLLKRGYAKTALRGLFVGGSRSDEIAACGRRAKCEWRVADVRDMSEIETKSIDVAFDKGTLDAMIYGSPWSPPDEVMENSGKYINEVLRVLKDDGVFLYVTYRQPHFVKPILNRNNEWQLEMDTMGEGDSFEYYGFILRKHLE